MGRSTLIFSGKRYQVTKKWRIDIFIFNHVMSFDAEDERRAST